MKMALIGLIMFAAAGTAVSAQMPVASAMDRGGGYAGSGPDGRRALRGGDSVWSDGEGLNAFFYPSGYDPQYGSEGRVADARSFADGYGCRPIWNGKTGRYIPACN